MTTYAAPTTTQPAPPYGGPPAAPPRYRGGPSVVPPRRRRRTGIVAAAGAFVIALAATTGAVLTLTHPVTPAQHTINVVPPRPATYSSTEIQAAKDTACNTWDQAARTLASTSRGRAALADQTGAGSPETRSARSSEKLVGLSQITYLRSQISPATPAEVLTPIDNWITAQIDSFHGANVRDWTASTAALDRGNTLVDVIDAECGLR
jgi:hypothetical protein